MPKLDKDGKRELLELDEKIRTTENELHRLQEARRELINYYGMNKNSDTTGTNNSCTDKSLVTRADN